MQPTGPAAQQPQQQSPFARDFTRTLLARTQSLRYEALPDAVRQIARNCVLDWIGVTLGARDEPLAPILIEQARAEGGHPIASLVGHAGAFPRRRRLSSTARPRTPSTTTTTT